jgi:hypothetical protein
MNVHAPELHDYERLSPYKNSERDKYLRETVGIDPAILAAELGVSARFVEQRQRQLGLRRCKNPRQSNV